MKKISKSREFTKNTLMEAFWYLYKNQEIEKITIKQITDKAGYNRITFYEYFKDIYDVLDCIEEKILEEIGQKVNTYFESAASVHSDTFMGHMVDLANEYHEYGLKLFGQNGDKGFEDKIQSFLKDTLKNYSIKLTDLNDKYIIEFYTSGLVGLIRMWFRNGCDIPIKAFLNTIRAVL